jgi:hypothetical protein
MTSVLSRARLLSSIVPPGTHLTSGPWVCRAAIPQTAPRIHRLPRKAVCEPPDRLSVRRFECKCVVCRVDTKETGMMWIFKISA